MKKYRCLYTVKTTYYVDVMADSEEEAREKYDNWDILAEPEVIPEELEQFENVQIQVIENE